MPIGITFNETMAGAFALSRPGPEAGAQAGRRAGSSLAMHATVSIPDLDAFIADPKHLGKLKGSIDFAPLGEGIPAKSGVFNLFSPSRKSGPKYMIYELPFQHGGEPHYLAGKKHVHDDLGFDLWSDTTTLFTRLHAGQNGKAPVVGAGVLRLDMGDLLELMSTIKGNGAKSAKERAKAVAKFGSFFMGELWETYGAEM